MTEILETDSCIDDQAFGATNAEVGVKEDDILCTVGMNFERFLLFCFAFHWIYVGGYAVLLLVTVTLKLFDLRFDV